MQTLRFAAFGVIVFAAAFLAASWLNDYVTKPSIPGPPTVRPGQVLSFENNANRPALLTGWSRPEVWGVWSEATAATVGFWMSGFNVRSTVKLTIDGVALVIPGKVPSQTIEVQSGRAKLGEATFTDKAANFSVPLRVSNGQHVELRLLFPNAVVPKNLGIGSDDGRTVAFAIKSLRLDE